MNSGSGSRLPGNLPPPFFVVGAPRAGTTLAAVILDSHSRISVFVESYYYIYFRRDIHRYGDLRRLPNLRRLICDVRDIIGTRRTVDPPDVEEFLKALVAPTFEGVFTTLLYLYAQRQGKTLAGDKTPDHTAYLGEIMKTFPDSPVIFLMRDPRDTILSIRQAFGTSLTAAAWMWNQAFERLQNAPRPVHLVRYEDLVEKPDETVAAMCTRLGVPYEATMLKFFNRLRDVQASVPLTHTKLLNPVDTKSVGRYQTMPAHEIRWIEAACAAGMEALGYPFTASKPTPIAVTAPTKLEFVLNRLRFYWGNWPRVRRGLVRWKIVLRLRGRYLLPFRWLRHVRSGLGGDVESILL
jgi:hypothetical protein